MAIEKRGVIDDETPPDAARPKGYGVGVCNGGLRKDGSAEDAGAHPATRAADAVAEQSRADRRD